MEGKCLCGAVLVSAPESRDVNACHCGMCQRWGGGPFLSVHCEGDVRIVGADMLKRYRSSEWAERAFCGECGTHIFYRLLSGGGYAFPVGLFQEGVEFEFKEQIFIDRKPGYYDFVNPTANLTEAEVFAKYAPGGEVQ